MSELVAAEAKGEQPDEVSCNCSVHRYARKFVLMLRQGTRLCPLLATEKAVYRRQGVMLSLLGFPAIVVEGYNKVYLFALELACSSVE